MCLVYTSSEKKASFSFNIYKRFKIYLLKSVF